MTVAQRSKECGKHRGKSSYRSKRAARAGAVSVAKRNGDRAMSSYPCPGCHLYFLTSKTGRTL